MFKNILFPSDGSTLSEEAARQAVQFAKESGACLTVVYVKPEYPVSYASEGYFVDATPGRLAEIIDEQAQEIVAFVDRLCAEAGVECRIVKHAHDAVYKAIIATAMQYACDLVFMASHGRRGVDALLLGSETIKVLTHSTLPVLVYR